MGAGSQLGDTFQVSGHARGMMSGFQSAWSLAILWTLTSTDAWATPAITTIDPGVVAPGAMVTIFGRGFATSNTVDLGTIAIEHVRVASSVSITCTTNPACQPGTLQTLKVIVPATFPAGTYTISIRNDDGESNVTKVQVEEGAR